jgi:hypothetical protein
MTQTRGPGPFGPPPLALVARGSDARPTERIESRTSGAPPACGAEPGVAATGALVVVTGGDVPTVTGTGTWPSVVGGDGGTRVVGGADVGGGDDPTGAAV